MLQHSIGEHHLYLTDATAGPIVSRDDIQIDMVDKFAPEDRERLKQKFEGVPANQHTGGWDDLWQQDFTPWDRKGPSLALKDAVTGHAELFGGPLRSDKQRKRAFVPGELEHSSSFAEPSR